MLSMYRSAIAAVLLALLTGPAWAQQGQLIRPARPEQPPRPFQPMAPDQSPRPVRPIQPARLGPPQTLDQLVPSAQQVFPADISSIASPQLGGTPYFQNVGVPPGMNLTDQQFNRLLEQQRAAQLQGLNQNFNNNLTGFAGDILDQRQATLLRQLQFQQQGLNAFNGQQPMTWQGMTGDSFSFQPDFIRR